MRAIPDAAASTLIRGAAILRLGSLLQTPGMLDNRERIAN
jgi:hypothetical protein